MEQARNAERLVGRTGIYKGSVFENMVLKSDFLSVAW